MATPITSSSRASISRRLATFGESDDDIDICSSYDDGSVVGDVPESSTFVVSLSNAPTGATTAGGTGWTPPPPLPATELSGEQVARLMARAEDDDASGAGPSNDNGDVQEFNQREKTLPTPKTGDVIELDLFAPQPDGAPQQEPVSEEEMAARAKALAGDVTILRYYPEGSTAARGQSKTVTNLAITFNQPMVELGSIDAQDAVTPAVLDPPCTGAWRWTGVTTLQFVPDTRFAFSTTYTVSIPAGTASALGNMLPDDFSFSFTTNTLVLQHSVPRSSTLRSNVVQSLRPRILLQFDQAVDPEAILASSSITANNAPYSGTLTLCSDSPEILVKNPDFEWAIRGLRSRNALDHMVVFDLSDDLPTDAAIALVVAAGASSAEGPNTTPAPITIAFHTYPPFSVIQPSTSPGSRPGATWMVRFTNPIDYTTLRKDLITIEPQVEFSVQVHEHSATSISIVNSSTKNTTYTLTIARDLADIHGQALTNNTVTIRVGKPYLCGSVSGPTGMVTLQAASGDPTVFPVVVYNFTAIRVRIFHVEPNEYLSSPLVSTYNYFHPERENLLDIGKKVEDYEVDLEDAEEKPLDYVVNLEPFLQHPSSNTGQLYVVVEPTVAAWKTLKSRVRYGSAEYRYRPIAHAWVQITNIALAALTYSATTPKTLVWASQLATGIPLSDLAVSHLASRGSSSGTQLGCTDPAGVTIYDGSISNSGIVVASHADDLAFVTDVRVSRSAPSEPRWYVFDDRKLYKPNEVITVKGFLRHVHIDVDGAIAPDYVRGSISWTAYDSRGNKIADSASQGPIAADADGPRLDPCLTLSSYGAFHFQVALPDNLNLGDGRIVISYSGSSSLPATSYTHSFSCQEFRRPEYDVSASFESLGPHISSNAAAGSVTALVSAQYFAGGALADAETRWEVTAKTGSYTPPHRSDYTFGRQNKWWLRPWWEPAPSHSASLGTWNHTEATTDADGEHRLLIEFAGNDVPPAPITLEAAATVIDLNYQARFAKSTTLLHPSSLYVGYKVKAWGTAGEPLAIELVVVDVDGELIAGVGIDLEVTHSVTTLVEDAESGIASWATTEYSDVLHLVSPDGAPLVTDYLPTHGGSYSFTATVTDAAGSLNASSFAVNVRGKEPKRGATNSRVEAGELLLIADKQCYSAGDTGELLVQAPFTDGELLLTFTADGLQATLREPLIDGAAVVPFSVDASWLPNFEIRVDAVGTEPRLTALGQLNLAAPPKPALASGKLNLQVDKRARSLDLVVCPASDSIAPGSETSVSVACNHADTGAPAEGVEVTLVVVDEAVLALTGYKLSDPVETFFTRRSTGESNSTFSHESVLLLSEEDLERFRTQAQSELADNEASASAIMPASKACCARSCAVPAMMNCMPQARGMCAVDDSSDGDDFDDDDNDDCLDSTDNAPTADDDAAELAEGAAKVRVRTKFDALAHFSPTSVTDASGRVELTFTVPDSLTRYRIWAIAATDTRYGLGESKVTAQLPLMVRPSPPRFLNYGDSAVVPVVLQNQTSDELKVYIGCSTSNLELAPGFAGGYVALLAPGQRGALSFPVATAGAGTARLQWVAAAGDFTDAIQKTVPVFTPATSEATATYGDTENPEGLLAFDLRPPLDAIPHFGGAQVSLTSTAVAALTDAFIYLHNYPYECCEQIASKLLGILPLLDVLEAFDADDIPSRAALQASVSKDMKLLARRQKSSGGFGYWNDRADPYVTCHVAHALAKCVERGLDVPDNLVSRTIRYLQDIDSHLAHWPFVLYSLKTLNGFRAYAAFALTRLGVDSGRRAAEVFRAHPIHEFSLEALGWLLVALSVTSVGGIDDPKAAILKHLAGRVNETAQTAFFVSDYGDEGAYVMLHSNRRTDAVLLEALLEAEPDSDLIVKVAKGLLAHRRAGKWRNTQENAFCLVALHKYFTVREAEVPDFAVHLWLASEFAGTAAFAGRTTDTLVGTVPMAKLLDSAAASDRDGLTRLIVEKSGPGRLYYRIAVDYAPAALTVDALDRGFTVAREYVGVDSPDHAVRADDGSWRIALGEKIRVRVYMRTTQRRYHVALVDQLPAGFEALNPALKGTPEVELKNLPAPAGAASGNGATTASRSIFAWRWVDPLRWFEFQNLRDERAEAFRSLLWEGNYEFQYIVRATTAGSFVVPPAKAECMYETEIFGRSASGRVTIA
ncbi:uncharacterized protein AMSG_02198 [Thecamonas trahens ATCC 50062]|uniref:Alpha-2-macroglobulin domain-containing protein n=1 Tax=Thecamonas trahens ATCC 50062 TaxID=461836 RepID=A0A0L0DV59_THETB|nr:hypothetical protein AMSG_02198 [Thecamonas trahens ATCC 50062]KNC56184.1 hypothetical protein AMSG_02198 [Thecamonas trahens ATCC 50062]|eukprot:XP_013761218.1 hypothetical protein AMSG_02198 [Thecamonas trahens ATCC 50062]